MKYFISAYLLLISLNVLGQPINYKDWQEEAKKDDRLLPEYGNVPRTKEQKATDEAYINTATEEMETNRHDGSAQLVVLGFNYYRHGDMRVAMYRFNQAWLLNPLNEEVYAGFGSVYFAFKDFDNAIKCYDKGLIINPNNPNLLDDKATSYLAMFEVAHDSSYLSKALELLRKSYAVNPEHPNTSYMLSRYYIKINNCDSTLKYYRECKKNGGQPITEGYTNAIKARCNALDIDK